MVERAKEGADAVGIRERWQCWEGDPSQGLNDTHRDPSPLSTFNGSQGA